MTVLSMYDAMTQSIEFLILVLVLYIACILFIITAISILVEIVQTCDNSSLMMIWNNVIFMSLIWTNFNDSESIYPIPIQCISSNQNV